MTVMWGIHNDRISAAELVADGFISIGWDEIGDLRLIGDGQAQLKAALTESERGAKPGAIPVWAGVLRRFAFEMAEGDVVIAPSKQRPVFNIGRVAGPYEFHEEYPEHRHRRRVAWLVHDAPRVVFTQGALYELGSAMTLFKVTNHGEEFLRVMENGVPATATISDGRTRWCHSVEATLPARGGSRRRGPDGAARADLLGSGGNLDGSEGRVGHP